MTDNYLSAVDSFGSGRELFVVVRDSRTGSEWRIDFKANMMGQYRHDGGRGGANEEAFEKSKQVAKEYVEDELGKTVIPRDEWFLVKPTTAVRVLEDSDEYRVERVDSDE